MTRRIAVVLLAAAPLLLAGCGQSDTGSGSSGQGSGGACTYTPTGDAARKVDLPPSDPSPATSLKISTNRGVITATLDGSNTPCTANSFTSLAKQGYFDGTTCHRLTTQGIFVLQCGDPTGTGSGGPGYAFDDELTGQETYPAGTLAMANSGRTPTVRSSSSCTPTRRCHPATRCSGRSTRTVAGSSRASPRRAPRTVGPTGRPRRTWSSRRSSRKGARLLVRVLRDPGRGVGFAARTGKPGGLGPGAGTRTTECALGG